jgi:hypothetical protein
VAEAHDAIALKLPDVVNDLRRGDAAIFDVIRVEALRRQRFMVVPEQFDYQAAQFVIEGVGDRIAALRLHDLFCFGRFGGGDS